MAVDGRRWLSRIGIWGHNCPGSGTRGYPRRSADARNHGTGCPTGERTDCGVAHGGVNAHRAGGAGMLGDGGFCPA
jgi:hypothetical protein